VVEGTRTGVEEPGDVRGREDGRSPRATTRGTALRPHKVAILLANQIVQEIIDGGLLPGARLASEREMLQEYNVSRGTLREALRYLELQGVLTIRPGPGGGPVVQEPDGHNLASVLGLLLALSRTQFRDVVVIREVLEPAMAARAATEASSAVLTAMRDSIEAMAVAGSDEDFLDENRRFHDLVAEGADNQVFKFFNTSLHALIDGAVMGIRYSPARRLAVIEAHIAVVEALESRDPERARRAMERHLGDWSEYVRTRHRAALNRPIVWHHAVGIS
jgi:GntR family transcriptional regulator, transcriptional repressor for pyruvate dehydrogenase complex